MVITSDPRYCIDGFSALRSDTNGNEFRREKSAAGSASRPPLTFIPPRTGTGETLSISFAERPTTVRSTVPPAETYANASTRKDVRTRWVRQRHEATF
jgi:hypothetical protein